MTKKILCLGAYANGNLGDMYQADALARLIKSIDPDVQISSVSPSERDSSYPCFWHEMGERHAAFDPGYINTFDLLLVGGGGLLSALHPPLHDEQWVAAITIPIIAMSLGAIAETVEKCGPFVKKCQVFSVRDEFSYEAVRSVRPDAKIIMDPILLDAVAQAVPPQERGSGITWVPGRLVHGTDQLWLSVVQRNLDRRTDSLVSFNPETDRNSGFDLIFDKVEYLQHVPRFVELMSDTRFVVSERYHACIYALAHGIPALGVGIRSSAVTSKIQQLFNRLGYPDAVVRKPFRETRADLVARASILDMPRIREYLLSEREGLNRFLTEVLDLRAR